MKTLTLIIYFFLTISWFYILVFSAKELIKTKQSDTRSLFIILFSILLIDAIRTLIESLYFGTRLSAQYGIFPKELFVILSNPSYLFIPKLINAIAAIAIIFLILKKWYPNKIAHEQELKEKLEIEKKANKNLDKLIQQKTIELEELNKNLEKRVLLEVEKNKKQEQTLLSQSKMAAMGEMIRNIAHQWRQPLSTITTISSGTKFTYEMGKGEEKMLFENLDKITQTGKYLSQTIEDFQNFFKPAQNSELFNCNDLVAKTKNLVDASLKSHNIELKVHSLCKCELFAPYNEYIQVLINLINNAKDAIIENTKENRLIKIELSSESNNCILKVIDNAGGIPENILDRIFEPYFTTKHKSIGTGIGLYMSKTIIEDHMFGSIEAKNIEFTDDEQTYKGAEFTIKIKLPDSATNSECCK